MSTDIEYGLLATTLVYAYLAGRRSLKRHLKLFKLTERKLEQCALHVVGTGGWTSEPLQRTVSARLEGIRMVKYSAYGISQALRHS